MSKKYDWTLEDDFTCCMAYLDFVFNYTGEDDLKHLVDVFEEKLPHISRGSLRMKAQNIKQIALDAGLEDRLSFSPLANYSVQCKHAFDLATNAFEEQQKRI